MSLPGLYGMHPQTGGPFFRVIQRLGLTGNLQLCLDAGDSASYTSGQPWLDRSGNGYDFNRGTTSGADATDPTFNGTAGGLSSSEYWSFDGGDYFTYDTTNETWMQNIHKDNAAFTILMWVYIASSASSQSLCGTTNETAEGFRLQATTAPRLSFVVRGAAGAVVLSITMTSPTYATGVWNCFAISLDEAVGANGAMLFMNGSTELFTSTYSSPSASSAAGAMTIGSTRGSFIISNGSRMAGFAAWSTALSETSLRSIYQQTRGRFGV